MSSPDEVVGAIVRGMETKTPQELLQESIEKSAQDRFTEAQHVIDLVVRARSHMDTFRYGEAMMLFRAASELTKLLEGSCEVASMMQLKLELYGDRIAGEIFGMNDETPAPAPDLAGMHTGNYL